MTRRDRRDVVHVEMPANAAADMGGADAVMSETRGDGAVDGAAGLQAAKLHIRTGDDFEDQFLAFGGAPRAERPAGNPRDRRQHVQRLIIWRPRLGTRGA